MSETVHSINLIVSNPKVRGGRPCIAGTGVRVSDVALVMLFHHQDVDGLAAWFGLDLAHIHAALAYYYQHKIEIDADIRQQIADARALRATYGDPQHALQAPKKERILGLHAHLGPAWVSDDFDAPLPDSCWLGD